MTPFLQFALAIAIIILGAKLGGYLSYRLGQPSVLGELLVGLIIGPSLLNVLGWSFFTDEHLVDSVDHLAELGVLLLMSIAGLDLHLNDLVKSGRVAALAGILGVLFPLLLGFVAALAFQMDTQTAFFIGLVLSATSVSISAQTLMELGVLRTGVGIGLLGAAVFDDILVVLGLSVFVALSHTGAEGSLFSVLIIVVQMVLYLGIASVVGAWLLPRLSGYVDRLPISRGLVAFTFVVILIYGWAAEALGGMAAITGSFLAGLLLSQSIVKEKIERGISTLAYGVFVPIFFVNVGLSANVREFTSTTVILFAAMTLVAIIGKVIGSGLGSLMGGFNRLDSLRLGVGMMSRGEVGLIVASVGIAEGLVQQDVFSAIVGVVIVTTLMTPPALRSLFSRETSSSSRSATAPVGEQQ